MSNYGTHPEYDRGYYAGQNDAANTKTGTDNMALVVSPREFNTILAALRFWQRAGNTPEMEEYTIANDTGEDDGSDDALSDDEIDTLCERLNC